MPRTEVTIESLHRRQAECLPGKFGLVVTRIAEGEVDAEVALQPWMLAPNGYLHAASVLLLADTAAGYASFAHLPDGAKNFTTIELKSNFLGTVREGTIRTECRAEVPITLYEAVLGGKVRVPTLDGAVELAIPAGTNSGRTFRLKGKGFPGKERKGDLLASIRIVLPDGHDGELEALMRKWRDSKPYDPREGMT